MVLEHTLSRIRKRNRGIPVGVAVIPLGGVRWPVAAGTGVGVRVGRLGPLGPLDAHRHHPVPAARYRIVRP
jgi:hypothetical protein